MIRHLIIVLATCATISAIAYYTMLYNIEAEKQFAFMMKVCTDAGGDWIRGWSANSWHCERHK